MLNWIGRDDTYRRNHLEFWISENLFPRRYICQVRYFETTLQDEYWVHTIALVLCACAALLCCLHNALLPAELGDLHTGCSTT